MSRHVVLLTDFGLLDPYVGQMKGALARHAPDAPVIDLCHAVEPGNAAQAGFMLRASLEHFPEASVFACVVDPGVGTSRSVLIARAKGRFVLAPDNGLLAPLLDAAPEAAVLAADISLFPTASATFHGRDIFAPLAARLARGALPETLGRPVDASTLVRPAHPRAAFADGRIDAQVAHVDRFGNCLLNMEEWYWLPRLLRAGRMSLPGGVPVRLVRT